MTIIRNTIICVVIILAGGLLDARSEYTDVCEGDIETLPEFASSATCLNLNTNNTVDSETIFDPYFPERCYLHTNGFAKVTTLYGFSDRQRERMKQNPIDQLLFAAYIEKTNGHWVDYWRVIDYLPNDFMDNTERYISIPLEKQQDKETPNKHKKTVTAPLYQ